MSKVIKLIANNVEPQNIPFNHDPLTLILKNTLVGSNSKARMFVNISPSKYDTAVTNRSLKFAMKTGRVHIKPVDSSAIKMKTS